MSKDQDRLPTQSSLKSVMRFQTASRIPHFQVDFVKKTLTGDHLQAHK